MLAVLWCEKEEHDPRTNDRPLNHKGVKSALTMTNDVLETASALSTSDPYSSSGHL